MAELRIPITSEFKGKKAFDQAGKATSVLDKSVKRLGSTLLGVFGAQQMARYAKTPPLPLQRMRSQHAVSKQ
jgi:hypothetical protein